MQPDYMAMAEGQQQPNASVEDIFENIKNTLMELQMVKGNEMDAEIQELAQLIIAGDEAAIEQNKLFQVIQESVKQVAEGAQAEQGQPTGGPVPQQGEAPKDFASMMPPTPGGGMGGR
jgi:hypothetical protein